MKYLVAGGAGFLGINLCLKLLREGNKVISVDNFSTGSKKNINLLSKIGGNNFKFIKHNITKKLDIKCDFIFNLACPASPPKYQDMPLMTLDTNFNGTINLCKLALKNDCSILHTSTSEIYGDPLVSPQNETYRGNVNTMGPRACYDEGKRISETLLYEFNKNYNLDIKIVRIFNTFGPFMSSTDGRVISNFINQSIKNKKITIYGKGNQTRSICYVDDTISGILKYAKLKKKFIGPINIGNDIELSIKDIAKKIIKLTNSKSELVYKKLPLDDPLQRLPDISLARKILKWSPIVNLEAGLTNTIKYFSSLKD